MPYKNIRIILGKPLIAWTAHEAKKSKFIDRIILSTDDAEIASVAEEYDIEVPFIRPKELAEDQTLVADVILHAIEQIPKYDYILLLQPTSPLRKCEDIDDCLRFCMLNNAKACISVTEPDKSPYWMYRINKDKFIRPLLDTEFVTKGRQDLPKVFIPNGAIYIAETDFYLENNNFVSDYTLGYEMPKERSLDIDTEIDFEILEAELRPIQEKGQINSREK